jgi:polysaccharide export outer membrane protein
VKVLRINDQGNQDVYVMDLTKAEEMVKSPGYMIQQNDVIYVQPNNYRKRQSINSNETMNASFWVSVVSVLTTLAVLIFK